MRNNVEAFAGWRRNKRAAVKRCGDHDWVLIDQYDGDAVRRAYAIATCLLAMACSSVMILSLPSLASTGAARTLGYL